MKFLPAIAIAAFLFGGSGRSGAQTANWHNEIFDTVVDSDGQTLDEYYAFELGLFVEGFIPDASNVDQWKSNWIVIDQAAYDPTIGYFTGVAEFTEATSMFAGEVAYIWVSNGDVPVPGTEWLLVSDESWMIPELADDCCGNTIPLEWSTTDLDAADEPVFGSQDGVQGGGEITVTGGYALQTATFAVVPEPATAAMFLAAFGAVWNRRRR